MAPDVEQQRNISIIPQMEEVQDVDMAPDPTYGMGAEGILCNGQYLYIFILVKLQGHTMLINIVIFQIISI